VAGKPKSRCHASGVAYEGGRVQAIPPQSGVTACKIKNPKNLKKIKLGFLRFLKT